MRTQASRCGLKGGDIASHETSNSMVINSSAAHTQVRGELTSAL